MLSSKWENLSRCSTKLIHLCKKLPLALDCRQSKYSLLIFNIYIYIFFNLGHGFCGSFSMLFPEAPVYCDKGILKWFLLHCTSIRMSSKSVSSFQTGDINIFVLRGVFSSGYFRLKSPFLTKKISAVKSEANFSREAIKV